MKTQGAIAAVLLTALFPHKEVGGLTSEEIGEVCEDLAAYVIIAPEIAEFFTEKGDEGTVDDELGVAGVADATGDPGAPVGLG